MPGRGVRVAATRLGAILAALLDGALTFNDLVDGMDVRGMYQGNAGRPAYRAPAPPRAPRPSGAISGP